MQTSFLWQKIFPFEIQRKNDIEFYDKVMDLYPDYPKIWGYNLVARYKAKVKGYFSNLSKI
jgi:hypothetical protein